MATSVAVACVLAATRPGSRREANRAWRLQPAPKCLVEWELHSTGFRFFSYSLSNAERFDGTSAVLNSERNFNVELSSKPAPSITFVPTANRVQVLEAGWPLACVHGQRHYSGGGCIITQIHTRGLLHTRLAGDDLPFLPRPGLAVDSILYGAAWYPLIGVPALIIRRRRRGAGLCAFCGYDCTGVTAEQCPECGGVRTV